MRALAGGLAIFLASLASPALATPPSLLWCDGCSDAQKRTTALTRPIRETVYVGDTINRSLDAYVVTAASATDASAPESATHAVATAPISPYADIGHALIQFHDAPPIGWSKRVDLNYSASGKSICAYDVVFAGPDQNRLLDWVAQQPDASFQQDGRDLLGLFSMFRIVDASKVPAATFAIHFDDASQITITEDFSTTRMEYRVTQDSGIDSHRNAIPSMPHSGSVPFDFSGPGSPDDQRSWRWVMTLLGYDIPTTPGLRWTCTNASASLRCVHPH